MSRKTAKNIIKKTAARSRTAMSRVWKKVKPSRRDMNLAVDASRIPQRRSRVPIVKMEKLLKQISQNKKPNNH